MYPQQSQETVTSIQVGSQLYGWIVESLIMRTELSELWKVRNSLTGKLAALKVIAEELMQNQDMMQRFIREITLLTELRYEHVPPAIGYFPVGPRYAVVSKWIDGPTLAGVIEQRPQGMPLVDIVRISVPILRTLHQMHSQVPNQLIHRDIKPLNIMIEKPTPTASGKPYLIDFGIALVRGETRLSRSGMIVGSPHYTAPEMIQRQFEIGHSVDIYAFGIMLYEMATGRKPFDAPENLEWHEFLREMQHKHIYEMPPWVSDSRKDLGDDFEMLVQKAIEKDPARRWASCAEMADLLELLAGPQQPVVQQQQNTGKVRSQVEEHKPGDDDVQIVIPPVPPISKALQLALTPGAALLGGAPLISSLVARENIEPAAWIFAGVGAVASFAGYLRIMYRAWDAIQDGETQTMPEQVLREHFFFPWTLVAIWRYFAAFGNNYNQFVERNQYDIAYMGSVASNLFVTLPFFVFGILLLPDTSGDEKATRIACFVALFAVLVVVFSIMISRICDAVNDIQDARALQDAEKEVAAE
jgi:serine/threonine-protein kinase